VMQCKYSSLLEQNFCQIPVHTNSQVNIVLLARKLRN
jgi:hypothetical protein